MGDAKSGELDAHWTAFANAPRYKRKHASFVLDGDTVDSGFDKCSPVALTIKLLRERLIYAKSRGFRVGLYFADGMNAGTALPGFSNRLVLKRGGWVGPDTIGDSYCMNPSAAEVSDFFRRYAAALLRQYGDLADALVWDETNMVGPNTYGSADVPGYSSRAMMRLVRNVAHQAETHDPPVAFLTSDCLGAGVTAGYALVAHGTYQDTWCQPVAWSFGIFPNWRNTLWSCCWWPIHKWKWVEFGVRNYQAPVAISNGWGDNMGFSEMTPEMRKKVLDLFHWRAHFKAQMTVEKSLPLPRSGNVRRSKPGASKPTVLSLALPAKTSAADSVQTIHLDADSPGPAFEGIRAVGAGASTRLLFAYLDPQRSEILDYLFKPMFGAGFQHLKVEIGSGENSTCGSEPSHAVTRDDLTDPKPRGYEF